MLAALIVGLTLAATWVVLLGVIAGRPWLVLDNEALLTKLVPTLSMFFFTAASFATAQLCSGGFEGDLFVQKKHAIAEPSANTSSTPGALFAMLLVQGVLQVASLGSDKMGHALFCSPMLGVHAMATLFYGGASRGHHCTLAARWADGSGVIPLHYALWTASISSQVLTLSHLERRLEGKLLERKGDCAKPSTVPRTAHRRCAIALLSVQVMLLCGGLGDTLHGPLPLNWLCLSLSFVAFYTMLVTGILRPLATCREHSITLDAAANSAAAQRYTRVAAYLITAWHSFPIVWACDNSGVLSDEEARLAYIVADILAKVLPPSVYVTMVAVTSTA